MIKSNLNNGTVKYFLHIIVCPGYGTNSFSVKPSYSFWAPWIGRYTRRSSIAFNTEYRKCVGGGSASHEGANLKKHDVQEEESEGDPKLSEEDLVEMMDFADVRTKYRKQKTKRFPFLPRLTIFIFLFSSVCFVKDENATRPL